VLLRAQARSPCPEIARLSSLTPNRPDKADKIYPSAEFVDRNNHSDVPLDVEKREAGVAD